MVMANPRGRPKKPSDELLAERVELRLTPVEKAQYELAANRTGFVLSAWIRDRLGKAAKRDSR
jgi:hypothetical protein